MLKYETGEIEISISVVNQLAEVLDTTPFYLLGYSVDVAPIRSLADVMGFLFKLEEVSGIDVKRPPRSKEWKWGITFNGKADTDSNTDMCLFLEDWENQREEARSYQLIRASLLVEMGFSPLLIAERLGHGRVQTTMATYSHLSPNKQAEVASRLDGVMG